ncbi:MAG: hypothetical protein R3Y67_08930 [Eubacteriales bacterium]
MKASIYLNNDKMQLVWTVGKQVRHECVELEEGSVLNGVPIRPENIVEQLLLWRRQYKIRKVSLIVDSNHINMKKMVLPQIPRKQLIPIIRNEFEVERKEDYIFDYSVLEKGKKESTVIASATPIEFVEKYLKCFDKAKIQVQVIDIALIAIVKYVIASTEFQKENLLINVVFGNTLFTVLFRQGEYIFSNRNRLLNESTDEEYIVELYEKLASMLQFAKSQKTDFEIQKCLYIGMESDVYAELKEYIMQFHPVLGVIENEDDNCPSECFYASLMLANKKVDINLKKVRKTNLQKMKVLIKPAIIVTMVILCITPVYMWYMKMTLAIEALEMQITVCDAYINDESILAQIDEIEGLESETTMVEAATAQYTEAITELEEHDLLTVATFRTLFSMDTAVITGIEYDSTDMLVEVEGTAASRIDAASYVANVRTAEHFDYLYYTIYSVDNEITDITAVEWSLLGSWTEIVPLTEEELAALEEGEATDE